MVCGSVARCGIAQTEGADVLGNSGEDKIAAPLAGHHTDLSCPEHDSGPRQPVGTCWSLPVFTLVPLAQNLLSVDER